MIAAVQASRLTASVERVEGKRFDLVADGMLRSKVNGLVGKAKRERVQSKCPCGVGARRLSHSDCGC